MITLRTIRQQVEVVKDYFYPYINRFKQTRLNNVINQNMASEEYLSAVVINCLLTEIETLLTKKLINNKGFKIKFEFTDAQAVVLYKTLLNLPLPAGQVYMNMVRSEWLQLLDHELIKNNLYQNHKSKREMYEYEHDDWTND
ncbi:MAG: hypothetical protein ACTHKV_13890 [Flavipsychrobacter sp.]